MVLHLIKLCAGADGVDDLRERVDRSVSANIRSGRGRVHTHQTRMFPRRRDDLLAGGSIYWVIKGVVLVRQRLLDLEKTVDNSGNDCCAILLDPALIPTDAQPRRAFQGWRYLKAEDAPRDLPKGSAGAPPALRAKLAELGLL